MGWGMAQQLRYHGTGHGDAIQGIPEWPARADPTASRTRARNAPGMAGSLSERHADQIWTNARQATAIRAPALLAQSGPKGIKAMVAMEFVSRVAGHIVGCPRCQQTGRWDTATPAAWLLWAMGKRPQLKAIMRPVLWEMGQSLPSNPPAGRPGGPRTS